MLLVARRITAPLNEGHTTPNLERYNQIPINTFNTSRKPQEFFLERMGNKEPYN